MTIINDDGDQTDPINKNQQKSPDPKAVMDVKTFYLWATKAGDR